VFRARLILALAEGVSYRQIMATLQTTAPRSRESQCTYRRTILQSLTHV
jgi:hypothetical protein